MFKFPHHAVLLMALAVVFATTPAGIGIAGEQPNSVPWFENGLESDMEFGFGLWRILPASERSAGNRFRLSDLSQFSVFPDLAESLLPGCLVGQCGDQSSGAVSEYDGGPMLAQFGLKLTPPPEPEESGVGSDATDTAETDTPEPEVDEPDDVDQEEPDTLQAEETERPPIPSVEDEAPQPFAGFPLNPPEEEEESFISSLPWWAWAVGGAIALVVLSSSGGGGGGGGSKSDGDSGGGGQGSDTGSVGYTW